MKRQNARQPLAGRKNVWMVVFCLFILVCVLAHPAGGLAAAPVGETKAKQKKVTGTTDKKLPGLSEAEKKKFSAFSRSAPVAEAAPLKSRPQHDKVAEKPLYLTPDVEFSGGKSSKELSPHRAPLPGGKNTLSQFDREKPKEVSMKYRLHNGTAARFTVNQQDENSPLYTPMEGKSDEIASAGVGLDVAVKKDLKLMVGAEHKVHEGGQYGAGSSTPAQGASVGFSLSF